MRPSEFDDHRITFVRCRQQVPRRRAIGVEPLEFGRIHTAGSQRRHEFGGVWRRSGRPEDEQCDGTDHHPQGNGDQDVERGLPRGNDAEQH